MIKYIILIILTGMLLFTHALGQEQQNNLQSNQSQQISYLTQKNHIPVCAPTTKDKVRCYSRVIVDDNGKPKAKKMPNGYGPEQFLSAYSLNGKTTSNQIIAIIDAYDHPNITSDLRTYSKTFHLPLLKDCSVSTGTVKSPCFQKIDQRGGTSYPTIDSFWALETSLDVEIAHAICQNCNILLIEADSNGYTDMLAAFDKATTMGATVISNSYGSREFLGEDLLDSHFNISGIAITFSSGDTGFGTSYPAASPYVTAVGGTTLNMVGNSYVGENVWSGTGSGCSLYESQPSFQTNLGLPGCSDRMIADVSADADPRTGAAVYDSTSIFGISGWFQLGGTSLSSIIVAGTYALAGGAGIGIQDNSIPYIKNNRIHLHDILSGSNGICDPSYLCTAANGYDSPSGLGTPNGSQAFG